MAITAAVALGVNYLQWDAANKQAEMARNQLAFAKQSAADSATDTQNALGISTRAANAAEAQALATKDALRISDRVAKAAESQAQSTVRSVQVAERSLAAQLAGHILITAEMKYFDGGPPFQMIFSAKNVGTTTVTDVSVGAVVQIGNWGAERELMKSGQWSANSGDSALNCITVALP